ncbi:MAG: isoleucine--tRNA ligase [Patescibacteria group bacterium]|nr:isoleucine--tRNA ligase [Patescibacteria group bacterium]
MSFKPVDQKVNFVEIEKKWLLEWKANDVVAKYLRKNEKQGKSFFFLDGPITANNQMGVHHAWGRTYKDLWQRFKNMQGFRQTFRNGFDNQGLWVEVGVEKELGFKTKKDIEKYGVEKFVNKCKEATLYWASVQTEQSKRLGYFMDWDNSYYTMSDDNNYTIWHFLKNCFEKGWLYKGRDSVPWCPRCGTAISQHEILQEEYKELTHESIYFELPVVGQENERFLVWTTTPWTLPANVALAVNPEFEYFLVTGKTGINFWVVGELSKSLFGEDVKVIKKVKGQELVGLKYLGPFDKFPAVQAARKENPDTFHTVVASKDLVTATEGTGIVHIATGCGQEDFALGKETGLPIISAIDEAANYLSGFDELCGQNAKINPKLILENPLLKDYIFEIRPYLHRYPVCWRCQTELVWRVVDEWYIKMDPLREPLKKAAREAKWIPEWGLDREIDWLNHMSDWLISKKRYWGLALPIWECKECGNFEVIGSKEELKEKAVEGYEGFEGNSPHRPWVDGVKIKCGKCGGMAERIPDVGNPWLDAGIVPFSTLIDPESGKVSYLTDKKYWAEWFPADFVTESFPGQFKNWFYAILAMSTVLEDKAPFKALLGYATVVDEKGEPMHKSKGNAIWFDDAAEKIGVDVMRWMYVTQNPVLDLRFGYILADETRRRFHLLLWNVYNYFVSYAILDGYEGQTTDYRLQSTLDGRQKTVDILDQWILSRLNNLVKAVSESLEKYDAYTASWAVEGFVNELSTWYVRRSRDRVGVTSTDITDKMNFYSTMYQVLLTLSKILAPFIPFLSEEIYKNLSEEESVHLTNWPVVDEDAINLALEKKMTQVREIVEAGHGERKKSGVRVRQPLAKITVKTSFIKLEEPLLNLIKDELNVKEVELKEGPEGLQVELDTTITPELKEEGEVRDLIRQIQEARKEAGCGLKDLVEVGLPSWPEKFEAEIKRKTLASKIYQAEKVEIKKDRGLSNVSP